MAYPPPVGQPPLFGAPPFPLPPGGPGGMQPPPGAGMLGMPPPGIPPMGFPPRPPLVVVPPPLIGQHTVSAPPTGMDGQPVDVPTVMSTATMKVQTTVFVGNISEKASDTLVRQILLRCGQIEGWKRVKDASGKLQAFGFCEYAIPESTLRAIRLLDGLRLGEKALVVKVDAKTRKDLLKYIITKKKGPTANMEEVEAEVNTVEEEGRGMAALTEELTEDMKKEDSVVQKTIDDLLRDHLAVLSSNKTNEDVQREHDVQESILFMAKQSGNVDPDTTLDQVDMEDDMKMLVSDEIKRFRESYQKAEEKQHLKVREKLKEREEKSRDRGDREKSDKERDDRDRDRDREKDRDRDREKERDRDREKERDRDRERERESRRAPRDSSPSRRDRTRGRRRSRSRSPRRSRSPVMSLAQEAAELAKKKEKARETSVREEEEHEEKLRQRRMREREKAYREQLLAWESRERRKAKEHEREMKREEERRDDMEHEKRHLADFLRDYSDEKDDPQFYKSSLYNRRRSEREMEMEDDEKDRRREKEELEKLRIEVMEKQALGRGSGRGSSSESSPRREDDDEEDMDVPARHELEEDIPLTKAGYTVPASFKQIQSAPAVNSPEIKGHPKERSFGDGILIAKAEGLKQEGESPASRESPQPAKLAFELTKKTSSSQSASKQSSKASKLESIFSMDDEELDIKPKKKLVPIEYSDEEDGEGAGEGRNAHHLRGERGDNDVSMKLALLKPADSGKKLSNEERKKLVQTLVNNIPTSKEEVFKYELKWDQIDQTLIEKRIGPWINKKITEYIGEAEPVLTEFICNKLACHISPADILNDIAMVLDDEAVVFVVKLWRLLIYETEAKHLGIAKSY